jgi:predicted nuclease of predicted toxin-antitoxin system
MRFLIDMPVSPRIAVWLNEQEHDAVHAAEIGLGQATDHELLDRAIRDDRIIVTADTDFPQLLALARARTPGIILFRRGDYSAAEMIELLHRVLQTASGEDLALSICVVDHQRVRYRRLPIR